MEFPACLGRTLPALFLETLMAPIPFPRGSVAVLALALAAASACRVAAQDQLASLADLEKARSAAYTRISQLRSGQPATAADKDVMDVEARFLIYRFTVRPPADMAKFQKQLKEWVDLVEGPDKEKNRAFVKQFTPILITRIKDVFDAKGPDGTAASGFLEYRYAITNLAPMLVHFGRQKEPAFADYLADLLMDKEKHDLIKMFAARAL